MNNITNFKVNEAIHTLDRHIEVLQAMKVQDINSDYMYTHVAIVNVWRQVPLYIGSEGVMSSTLNVSSGLEEFLYIPDKCEIKPHMHTDIVEYITVISGKISYEISDAVTNKIIDKGDLSVGHQITFEPSKIHYVFTAKGCAYVLARIVKKN